jgi:hypothetical protein
MDNGVVPYNTISNNTASKLLYNVTLNSHTTWNDNPNGVPYSIICLYGISSINGTQLNPF